jgi:single-stranded DNA-binding protein
MEKKNKNELLICGRIGKVSDPITVGGRQLRKGSLCWNESYKKQDGSWVNNPYWYNIELWGDKASIVFGKGDFVEVKGSIKPKDFETRNGEKRTEFLITVFELNVLESKGAYESHEEMPI